MNETEQLKKVWQVLESRDQAILSGRQKIDHFKEQILNIERKNTYLQGDINQLREEDKQQIKLIEDLNEMIEDLNEMIAGLNEMIEDRNEMIAGLNKEVHQITVKLQVNQAKKESLEQEVDGLNCQLNVSEENRLFLLKHIDQLQEKLNDSEATIIGMESSKFWQVRIRFLKLKKSLGLKAEE